MAKVTRNFLFAGFLILGLIPTIICILFPPILGIVEKAPKNGLNVSLNNWYNTREHPSIEMPSNIMASLQKNESNSNQLFESQFSLNFQSQNKVLNIQPTQKSKQISIASFYNIKGEHINTTYFTNSNYDILLENVAANDYYLLLNADGNTFSKKITVIK